MILLVSGGIDSFVAYHYLEKPRTLFFNCNSRYSKKESYIVGRLFPDTIIDDSLDLRSREVGEKAYIPFRNLLFALQAVKYSDDIVIAGLADDMVSDKTPEAFSEFSRIMSQLEGRDIRVVSPFWGKTKAEVVEWYLKDYQGDVKLLLETTSCYDPNLRYCGRCPSCFRKWVALLVNNIRLPFNDRELAQDYFNRARKGFYHPKRNESIIQAVQGYIW